MKKIFIITILFFICSCSLKETEELQKYDKYIQNLNEKNIQNEEYPFDIDIQLDQINESEIMYMLSIDNAKEELNDIEVIVIHDYETTDIFPSSGIFEEKLSLSPNQEYPKGILLVGYIKTETKKEDLKIIFKCYIKSNEKDYYFIKQF